MLHPKLATLSLDLQCRDLGSARSEVTQDGAVTG
jgi:hypothetical protein